MSTLIAPGDEPVPASLFDTEELAFEAMAQGAAFTDARSREGAALATPFRPVASTRPGLTDHERDVLGEWGWTYELRDVQIPGVAGPVEIVSCRVCGHDSYHPDDRTNLYCSFCNAFHEDRERLWSAELAEVEAQKAAEINAQELAAESSAPETNQL